MKFDRLIEHALETTNLKKIRMRTDPVDRNNPESSDAYEGYIIEEQDGMVRVMMISPEVRLNNNKLSVSDLEPANGRTFDEFKSFVLNYIHKSGKCDCQEATHDNLANAGDIQHLEMFLKEQGVEQDEFNKIIKLFLMS